MRPLLVTALIAAGCVSAPGQKAQVLLQDRRVVCKDTPEGSTARFELVAEDDFYLAEFEKLSTGEVHTFPTRRHGTTVIFDCPTGAREFMVRHATLVTAPAGQAPPGSATAPTADTR